MYRVLKPFEFFEPETLEEVLQLLLKFGNKAKVLAGGVDLVLKMRLHQVTPEYIISLQKISGLDYIDVDSKSGLKIGASTTLRQVELSPIVHKGWILLHEAVHWISSAQAKSMGTIVGNLCVATPASDIAPVLFVMGASAKIVGDTEKVIPLEKLFVDVGKTCLKAQEIAAEISVPPLPDGAGTAFVKLAKTKDDIAKVNAAVLLTVSDGLCSDVKIALGSVAPKPVRVLKAEDVLKGQKLNEEVITKAAEVAADSVTPITDVRSTAEYRKDMVKILVKDSLNKAISRA